MGIFNFRAADFPALCKGFDLDCWGSRTRLRKCSSDFFIFSFIRPVFKSCSASSNSPLTHKYLTATSGFVVISLSSLKYCSCFCRKTLSGIPRADKSNIYCLFNEPNSFGLENPLSTIPRGCGPVRFHVNFSIEGRICSSSSKLGL